jgi:hypothetical protein
VSKRGVNPEICTPPFDLINYGWIHTSGVSNKPERFSPLERVMSSNAFMTVGFASFFSVSKCSCLPKDSIMKKDKSATTAWELCSSLILPVIVLQVMTDPFVPITDNLYLSLRFRV